MQFRVLMFLVWAACLSRGHSQTNASAFVTLDKLSFMGFATPEATLQSSRWLSLNGSQEEVENTCVPEVRASNHMSKDYFEGSKEFARRAFGGFQILEKQTVETNLVEMKYLNVEVNRRADGVNRTTNYYIVTMAKIGREWKFAKETRKYDPAQDNAEAADPGAAK